MRFWRIPEIGNERMRPEQPLDCGTLHAAAASMDQTNLREAASVRGFEIVLHDRQHITRCKRMQIDGRFYRNLKCLVVGRWIIAHNPR
jgi:hypothetical protein